MARALVKNRCAAFSITCSIRPRSLTEISQNIDQAHAGSKRAILPLLKYPDGPLLIIWADTSCDHGSFLW